MLKILAVTAAAVVSVSSASAAVYSFDLSGSRNASFQLDTADATSSFFQTNFANVTGTFDGTTQTASLINFSATSFIADLNIVWTTLGFTQFSGPALYTGTNDNPMFTPGTYQLTSIVSGSSTLTIAAVSDGGAGSTVPEPASWALMIVGFGLTGVTLRRRIGTTATAAV
ncbi:PEPxxWA-CTERM sorting domain-containing protein [Sphingosinicellaceae bacterium]|nr:PEPxxWA-CTERM sorting domain-containing protein [Sphingosinicellaceae bacterium]